jgi:hypothetical protein
MASLPSTEQPQPSYHPGYNVYHACYSNTGISRPPGAPVHHMVYVETDLELGTGWTFHVLPKPAMSHQYERRKGPKPVTESSDSGYSNYIGNISQTNFQMVDAVLKTVQTRAKQSERRYPMLSISWNWVLEAIQALTDKDILDKEALEL